MPLIKIFIWGLLFLGYALIVNGGAKVVGLPSWYDFLANPKSVSLIALLWLCIGYPFLLGLFVYSSARFIS